MSIKPPATENGSTAPSELGDFFESVAVTLEQFEDRGRVIEALREQVEENDEVIDDVCQTLETLVYNQRAIEHETEKQRDEMMETDERVSEVEKRVEQTDSRHNEIEKQVENLASQVEELESKVSENAETAEANYEDIDELRSNIEGVRSLFSDRALDKEGAHHEAKEQDASEVVEVGDTREVCITNTEYDRHDPVAVARIDGLVTFVHVERRDLEKGDTANIKVTDIGDSHADAILVEGNA